MAAITTTAIGVAMAGYQIYQGQQQQEASEEALKNYKRQDLESSNAFKAVPISTVGSDIMREENQRTAANSIDALRNMGTRGAGMVAGVVAQNNRANQENRAYVDEQISKRDYAIAGDNQNIRAMKENRENADLAGIGQQMQVGQQNMWGGIRGLGTTAMYAANNIDSKKPQEYQTSVSQLKPITEAPMLNQMPTSSLDFNKKYMF
jgi:hypothetical protein